MSITFSLALISKNSHMSLGSEPNLMPESTASRVERLLATGLPPMERRVNHKDAEIELRISPKVTDGLLKVLHVKGDQHRYHSKDEHLATPPRI
jgi:hypothetical protein